MTVERLGLALGDRRNRIAQGGRVKTWKCRNAEPIIDDKPVMKEVLKA